MRLLCVLEVELDGLCTLHPTTALILPNAQFAFLDLSFLLFPAVNPEQTYIGDTDNDADDHSEQNGRLARPPSTGSSSRIRASTDAKYRKEDIEDCR